MANLISKDEASNKLIKAMAGYIVELDLESKLAMQNRSRLRSLGKYGRAREQYGIANQSDIVIGELKRLIQTFYRDYTGKNVNVKRIRYEGELPGSRLYATPKHQGGTAQVPNDDEERAASREKQSDGRNWESKLVDVVGAVLKQMKVKPEEVDDDDPGDEPEVDF